MVKIEMTWINGDVDTLICDTYYKTCARIHKSTGYKTTERQLGYEEFWAVDYHYAGKTAEELAEMTDGRLVGFKSWAE